MSDTRILSVIKQNSPPDEIHVTIEFTPSDDILPQLNTWINTLSFPLRKTKDGTYEYSEYLTMSKEVDDLLFGLIPKYMDSSKFIKLLEEIDNHWN